MHQQSPSTHSINRFSHDDIEARRTPQLAQNVIVPEEFWQSIKDIVGKIDHEVRLVLFAKLQETGGKKYHLVDFFEILGHGDETSVNNIPQKRFDLAEAFLRARQAQYAGIHHFDAHTHPFPPNSHFATNFSVGDLSSFGKIIARNQPDYRHVLFTRSHVVTFGREALSFQLARENPAVMPRYANLKRIWDELERTI